MTVKAASIFQKPQPGFLPGITRRMRIRKEKPCPACLRIREKPSCAVGKKKKAKKNRLIVNIGYYNFKKELYCLRDALPEEEVEAARHFLEFLP